VTPIFLPGLCDPDAAGTVRRHGHSAEVATEQAEAVFARLHDALETAGGTATDVCNQNASILRKPNSRLCFHTVRLNLFRDIFPAARCVLLICFLSTTNTPQLAAGIFISVLDFICHSPSPTSSFFCLISDEPSSLVRLIHCNCLGCHERMGFQYSD
jgi:hypothetical protein